MLLLQNADNPKCAFWDFNAAGKETRFTVTIIILIII